MSMSNILPAYYDPPEPPSSPTYSLTRGRSEHVVQPTTSSQTLPSNNRQWMFTTDHMSISLRSQLWDLHAPCYGLQGKVEGSVIITGEQSHVARVTGTLEGKITTTTSQRGTVSSQFVHRLLSRTITLYESYMKTFQWGRENTFSISFPVEINTPNGISKLPPSFSTWHPGVHSEVSYTLRFEMTRKSLRRHESKIIPILYLPKTTPTHSPLTIMPQPHGNLLEVPFPIRDRVKTMKIPMEISRGKFPNAGMERSVGSVYLSLPSPPSFASGETIPFTLRLVFPEAPALARLLPPHIRVKLVKRTRAWINAGREHSVRELPLTSSELCQVNQPTEAVTLLKGSIKAGMAGQECSWKVDGMSEVQYILRIFIIPPKYLEDRCPSFKHEETIQLTTDPWGTLERELRATGGIPTPALALAARNESQI